MNARKNFHPNARGAAASRRPLNSRRSDFQLRTESLRRLKTAVPLSRTAFTLIELLTVMAILALLSTFAGLGLSSVSSASGLGTNLSRTASYIDQARSYAIANGTYVYVGSRSITGTEPATEFVVVGSLNGDDLSSQTSLTVGSGDVALLAKPLSAKQVNLSADSTYDPPVTRPSSMPFSLSQTITVKGATHQTIMAFGPSGSVTFGGSIPSIIEFGLRQAGNSSKAGVIQVSGLTGISHVYQQ